MMVFWEIYYSFFKIGLVSFGGGYAMIPLMKMEFIDQQSWLNSQEFFDIMAVSEITPGPVSINIATFTGFKVGGFWGAVLATLGVVSPSIIILLLVYFFSRKLSFKKNPLLDRWGKALLQGIRPAAITLVALAALYLGEGTVTDLPGVIVFAASLALALATRLNPVLIIVLAGTGSLVVETFYQ